MKKLNSILLIDDDEPTNFFNKMIINGCDCTEKVFVEDSGQGALDFLKDLRSKDLQSPDLIFLDINMPGMTGWEFIEEYDKLPLDTQAKHVLMMLTTSLNPSDAHRAGGRGVVEGFLNKPLRKEDVMQVIESHFPENFKEA